MIAIFQFNDSHDGGGSHFHCSPGVMSVVRVQHFDACAHESMCRNDGFYASCCVFACRIKVDVIVLDAMFVVVQKSCICHFRRKVQQLNGGNTSPLEAAYIGESSGCE